MKLSRWDSFPPMNTPEEIIRFYKHATTEKDIKANLGQAREILKAAGLDERNEIHEKGGGRSGDLYVVHRNLWMYEGEGSFLTASVANDQRAQLFQLFTNNTSGWSGYLSAVLRGPFDEKVAKQFSDADFAPKHSYLAKDDRVMHPNYGEQMRWLDDIIEPKLPLSNQPHHSLVAEDAVS